MTGYHFEPDSIESAESLISYNVDEFEGDAWLKTEPVANMEYANAIYNLRAYFNDNEQLQFIQVYVNLRVSDWYFINDAAMKSENVTLSTIDKEVVSGGYVHENVAVNISIETLKRIAQKDTLVKLKGKKGNYIFSINHNVSAAFLNKLAFKTKI
ncbi:hypothetical protein [Aliivibrio logei]|nr:hypothetical protein [Aliivibrio logei]